jgi:hypothetical protein
MYVDKGYFIGGTEVTTGSTFEIEFYPSNRKT